MCRSDLNASFFLDNYRKRMYTLNMGEKIGKAPGRHVRFSVRLALGLAALSVLGLFTLFIIVNTVIRDIIYENVVGIAQRDQIIYAEEIDAWFGAANQTVRNLATMFNWLPTEDYFRPFAEAFVAEYEGIENVFVGFSDGRIKNGIRWFAPEGWTSVDRPWYLAATAVGVGNVAITDPYWSYASGNVAVAVATYVPGLSGVGATVGTAIPVYYVFEQIMSRYVMGGGYMILVGANGEILAHPNIHYNPRPNENDLYLTHLADIPNGGFLTDNIAAGVSVAEFEDFQLGPAYFIATHLASVNWMLVAVIPLEATRALMFRHQATIMLTLAVLLIALFLVTMIVVSYLTRSMEERSSAEERLRLIFDNMPLACNYRDKNHNILHCNAETLRFFNVPDVRVYQDRFFDLTPEFQSDGTSSREMVDRVTRIGFERGSYRFEWMHQTLDGKPLPCEVTFQRVDFQDGEFLLVFIRDLREFFEQKRAEIAEESNRAKTRFLARMSHEIRTPITAVLGISEIQLRNPAMPPQAGEAFGRIYDSANILLGIVNDILDLSRIEAGKLPLQNHEYEVASLISDASQLHVVYLSHKNTQFKLFVDDSLPSVLIGDALRIRQIMNNLLSNAFKYTIAGSVTLSFSCERGQDGSVMLIVKVSDTGMGMTEEQIKAINSEYTRFHERNNALMNGTGLGMPIVYSLLQMMDADIDIKSEVGKGTDVCVRIPQQTAAHIQEVLGEATARALESFETGAHNAKEKFEFEPEPMPYGRVLVVDDVEANLYVARGLLAFYDLHVDTCESGYAAVDIIKAGGVYDIIFMDFMMPGMNGTQTTQILRDMGYNHPVVALTANALIGQAEEFLKSGFDGFVSKPIRTHQLNDMLIKFVRDKQPAHIIGAARATPVKASTINNYQSDIQGTLRTKFATSHKNAFLDVNDALISGDIETAHRLAHSLKGLAGLIGEEPLAAAATAVEGTLSQGRPPGSDTLKTLEDELGHVLSAIGPADITGPIPSRPFDKDSTSILFDKLQQLLATRNADCLALLPDLRHIPETAVLIRQIEDFDYAPAQTTLKVLRGVLDV